MTFSIPFRTIIVEPAREPTTPDAPVERPEPTPTPEPERETEPEREKEPVRNEVVAPCGG